MIKGKHSDKENEIRNEMKRGLMLLIDIELKVEQIEKELIKASNKTDLKRMEIINETLKNIDTMLNNDIESMVYM